MSASPLEDGLAEMVAFRTARFRGLRVVPCLVPDGVLLELDAGAHPTSAPEAPPRPDGDRRDPDGDPPRPDGDPPISPASPSAIPEWQEVLDPVSRVVSVGRQRAAMDADLLIAMGDVVAQCRVLVLDQRGWTGIELSKGKTRTLLAETKRAAITEAQAALGFTTAEATDLVSLAMAPEQILATVIAALRRGETSWVQARQFWQTAAAPSRDLTGEQRLIVALALFGTDPALAARERLDPDGELTEGTPWAQARYKAALIREVTACEGADPAAERARRARAHRNRHTRIQVHDDGTATLIINGPATKLVAAWQRHDDIARRLRARGADAPISALACDSIIAVVVNGVLPMPDGSLDELTDTQLDDLLAVVNGSPRYALQVVVPVDALGIGHPVCATCASTINQPPDTTEHSETSTCDQASTSSQGRDGHDDGDPRLFDTLDDDLDADPFDRRSNPPTWAREHSAPDREDHQAAPPDAPADDLPDESLDDLPDESPDEPTEHLPDDHPDDLPDEPHRRGRGMVAEVIGRHPFFITPGHARELFYTPGTILFRLLTDPVDGRCLERTISAYRPDADMRRQVNAADVYSRAPWTRLTGRTLEIDHVIPYGVEPGGTTREANLANQDKRTHKIKTIGHLTLEINERRDLTYTTLLGQLTRSRTHDYRQYVHTLHPDDLEERLDLANQAVYAALVHDPAQHRAADPDSWITVTHTDENGKRVSGPPEEHPHPHQLLHIQDPDQDDSHTDPPGT